MSSKVNILGDAGLDADLRGLACRKIGRINKKEKDG